MIQQNEADVPEMLTEAGKWLDGDRLLFKKTSETRYWFPSRNGPFPQFPRRTAGALVRLATQSVLRNLWFCFTLRKTAHF